MQKQVLVVDDEATILLAFKKILQKPGINVDTAESIDDVKGLLNKTCYDAVIADLRLSGISGEEGLEVIRFVKECNPDTKVILMTAYGSQDVMKKAYNLGAAFYFEKPVSANVLKDALKNLGVI